IAAPEWFVHTAGTANPSILPRRSSAAASFFFQAEDGIRAFHVTGVQTCALPIWRRLPRAEPDAEVAAEVGRARERDPLLRELQRSEERRVGKECRSRWSLYQYINKS